MTDFINDKDTAKILRKSVEELYEIVDFFDSRNDDEWELTEPEHFEYVNRRADPELRRRRFTEEGVEALARYCEEHNPGILSIVLDALFRRRRRRKQMLVTRRVTQELIEGGGPLAIRGELAFVDKRTTWKILQSNSQGINNSIGRLTTAGSLEGQEGLELEKHFLLTDQDQKIWSQKGLATIALDMVQNSSIRRSKSRKAWVEAVGEVVEDCFKAEVARIKAAPSRISRTIKSAKRSANHTCQVSGRRNMRSNAIQLDGHHLFDKSTRPDLDDLHENILVVQGNIHREFHSWRGGESCEPKDFLDFLSENMSEYIDPVNSGAYSRYRNLIARLITFQRNFEGTHLRYR